MIAPTQPNTLMEEGLLLVVSAPSGTGKTSLCREILRLVPNLRFSVSYTTRTARPGEQEGRDYHFISREDFRDHIEKGNFLEWTEIYGNYYGTSKLDIKNFMRQGYDVLLDIDPRGAKNLQKYYPDGIFVFILPPSMIVLRERLRKRGTENDEMIDYRLEKALEEIKEVGWYDYVIFNDNFDESTEVMKAVYLAGKNERKRLTKKIEALFKSWRY